MGGLLEELGAQQEDRRQAGAGREERVREAEEVAEQLRWRVREEERERGEGERELETSREMERSLRYNCTAVVVGVLLQRMGCSSWKKPRRKKRWSVVSFMYSTVVRKITAKGDNAILFGG